MLQVATRRLAVLVGATLLIGAAIGACGDDSDSAGDPALFCERLDRLTRNDPFLAFGESAHAGDIEVAFGALVDRAGELLDVAPPEARGAAQDYAEAAQRLERYLDAEC